MDLLLQAKVSSVIFTHITFYRHCAGRGKSTGQDNPYTETYDALGEEQSEHEQNNWTHNHKHTHLDKKKIRLSFTASYISYFINII